MCIALCLVLTGLEAYSLCRESERIITVKITHPVIELAVFANSRSRINAGMGALINADKEPVAMVSDNILFAIMFLLLSALDHQINCLPLSLQ